ncbi:hypothetical protein RHSIM_Rhsim04G0058100 [Rhododendron simsii]|uniref:Terpene synthase metal-binding domain-containing protein n=1 Tax=Rhododendron simsii TaxID=118357 RepID=A0A834LRI2_RHOSS|nr:hypothetical protein RHSIM_Rhsim04G0058100 [Rhododendron simsii]
MYIGRPQDEIQKHRAKKLKGEIKAMIGDTDVNSLTILELIDDIQRLGLSHHFQKDITRALDRIFLSVNGNGTNLTDQQISVHATALCFMLCRQHGYEASQDMGLVKKLSFTRDRLMECFFWSVGIVSKPKLSDCRKSATKLASFINTIDDVYDVYGYLDELQLFTMAVDRWDIKAVETLPDDMKLSFLALYNTTNEMAYDILKQKEVNIIPYLTRAWADLCKAFLVEAKWCFNKETPTFKAYLENAVVSISGRLISVHAYFLLTETITKEALECLLDQKESYQPLMECLSLIFRLSNDLGTSKIELERGESVNSILYYMHETELSEQEARKHIKKLIGEAWKKMNKE